MTDERTNEHQLNFDDKAKKEFLAFLDHELRNPLAAILSSVELLQLEAISKRDAPELVKTIEKQTHIIIGILETLLNVESVSKSNSLSRAALSSSIQNPELLSVKHIPSILLVDDNEIAAEALKRLLESQNYYVVLANSGGEAVTKARELHPHIIILDIGLPDMDGYEVIRTLKEEKGFLPIFIALTGYGQADDKARAKDAGFHAHLTKPVSLKEIQGTLLKLSETSEPIRA